MTTDGKPRPKGKATTRDRKERVRAPPPPGGVADLYRAVLPTVDFEAEQTKWDVALTVPRAQIEQVLRASLRDERLAMDFLRNLTAVDWEEQGLELVYHLYSLRHHHSVTVKTWLPAEAPVAPSVSSLWRTADWAERECREMFGIEFAGHPDPRNLLLDEDLDIHPLRKSHPLAPVEMLQGVDVEFFRKEHPLQPAAAEEAAAGGDDERTQRIAQAKELAAAATAGAPAEKKAAADLTPEELATKKAAQAERVKRGRELAAAQRAAKAAAGGAPPSAAARPALTPPVEAPASQAEEPAAAAPPAADAAPPAPAAASAAPPAAAPAPQAPAPAADATPAEPADRKAAQSDRVRRARELAAARRAELRKEGR